MQGPTLSDQESPKERRQGPRDEERVHEMKKESEKKRDIERSKSPGEREEKVQKMNKESKREREEIIQELKKRRVQKMNRTSSNLTIMRQSGHDSRKTVRKTSPVFFDIRSIVFFNAKSIEKSAFNVMNKIIKII